MNRNKIIAISVVVGLGLLLYNQYPGFVVAAFLFILFMLLVNRWDVLQGYFV